MPATLSGVTVHAMTGQSAYFSDSAHNHTLAQSSDEGTTQLCRTADTCGAHKPNQTTQWKQAGL